MSFAFKYSFPLVFIIIRSLIYAKWTYQLYKTDFKSFSHQRKLRKKTNSKKGKVKINYLKAWFKTKHIFLRHDSLNFINNYFPDFSCFSHSQHTYTHILVIAFRDKLKANLSRNRQNYPKNFK